MFTRQEIFNSKFLGLNSDIINDGTIFDSVKVYSPSGEPRLTKITPQLVEQYSKYLTRLEKGIGRKRQTGFKTSQPILEEENEAEELKTAESFDSLIKVKPEVGLLDEISSWNKTNFQEIARRLPKPSTPFLSTLKTNPRVSITSLQVQSDQKLKKSKSRNLQV